LEDGILPIVAETTTGSVYETWKGSSSPLNRPYRLGFGRQGFCVLATQICELGRVVGFRAG
jgi:hypothetical protein